MVDGRTDTDGHGQPGAGGSGVSDLLDRRAPADFERLPETSSCPARPALDEGLSEVLGLPNLGTLRALLASEPVVSNRRL